MPEVLEETTIDHDKHGHCCKCHKNMLTEQVIDGKLQRRFLPDYDEVEYILNTGSRMRVAVCRKCKADLGPEDYEYMMDCVYKGWEHETNELVRIGFKGRVGLWTEEFRNKHLAQQRKLKIVTRVDNISDNAANRKFKAFENKKSKDK